MVLVIEDLITVSFQSKLQESITFKKVLKVN